MITKQKKLNSMQFFFAYWFPLILYCWLIFYLSSLIFLPGPPGILSDKTKHTLEYSLLAVLVFRLVKNTRHERLAYAAAILFCLIYGFSDEIHQYFVPTRDFSVIDLLFDGFGGAVIVIGDWLKGNIQIKSVKQYK